ncbi:acyl carrier protein [Streptomyces sp. NPDC005141]
MRDISYRFLSELVAYHFDIGADRLRPDTTFDELGMDSLALMELVVVLESETGIQIPDDLAEIGPTATLSEIADAVKQIGDRSANPPAGPVLSGDHALPRVARNDQFEGSRVE